MTRFVPLRRNPKSSLIEREVFVNCDLHRGECVNSVRQPIDVVDQHPDGVRHGPGPSRWLWGHQFSA
jgi:hypothetical protein